MSLWRTPLWQSLSKASDMSSASAWVALDLMIGLGILSNTTIRRSLVKTKELKSQWKSEERIYFLGEPVSILFLQDLQDFTNHIKNANKVVDFSSIPPPSILKFGQCRRDCPTIWKRRFKLSLYFQLTFFCFIKLLFYGCCCYFW